MIEQLKGFPPQVLAFACSGKVTREDYQTVLTPAVEAALKAQSGRVRLYYQVNDDFDGIAPGAMWEDFLVGVEHLTRWEKIAIVTNVEWIADLVKMFGFLMPGGAKSFPLAQADEARAWVRS